MALHKLQRRNYGGKSLVSIKYQNLHSFKEVDSLMWEYPWNKKSNTFTWLRSLDNPFKLTKHNNCKRVQNIAVSKIKELKKQFCQNYFHRNSKNLKKTWVGIKSVVTQKSKVTMSPNSLFIDSNIIANKTCI